jgi:Putative Ig domain
LNYFDLYSSYPDHTIAAAWDSQVKEADNTPWLAGTLTECGGELFTRFAACYAELRALPRSARRALQRHLARSSELAATLPEYLQRGGRRLQHRMAWSLAGAALLLALGQSVATAATITVTTNDPNVIPDGQCSLIEAIVNANNDAATHADCPAGSGADTIVLPANGNVTLSAVYGLTYGLYGNPVGLPPITSRITIEGNGAVIARQGSAPAFGLMAVRGNFPQPPTPGDLTLQSVTLSGGSSFGGLFNNGTLSIKSSVISGNTADFGGGGLGSGGTLTIENSTITGNAANFWGGGLYNRGSTTIINSTISGNAAGFAGGGVYNFFGALTIENSTISGNTANHGGGGLTTGSLILTNSTVSDNIANYAGGGLVNSYYCYFGCSIGTLTLNNSLIAGNQAPGAPEVQNISGVSTVSTVTANNFNLFGANGNAGVSGFTPGPTDIVPSVSLAQILGLLQNNGGPTQTHALVAGSPAIDAGGPGGCRDSQGALLLTEQRGFARHVDSNNDGTVRCDIGAFEYGAESVPIPSPLGIGATTLATGEAGVSFTSDLMISGGVAPYVVSIIKGKLPAGLSLGNDGIISGTLSPTARTEKVTVRITDSVTESVRETFKITVLRAVRIAGRLNRGRVGKDYIDTLKARGGLGPFNWSITSGALSPGLSFNAATGAITGTPTQEGEFPFTVQVTDALGGVAAENLTLKIK